MYVFLSIFSADVIATHQKAPTMTYVYIMRPFQEMSTLFLYLFVFLALVFPTFTDLSSILPSGHHMRSTRS